MGKTPTRPRLFITETATATGKGRPRFGDSQPDVKRRVRDPGRVSTVCVYKVTTNKIQGWVGPVPGTWRGRTPPPLLKCRFVRETERVEYTSQTKYPGLHEGETHPERESTRTPVLKGSQRTP